MYPKDENGEYQVLAKWVDAWSGGGSYVPGYTVGELRQYANGDLIQHVSERVIYVHKSSVEIAALHKAYIIIQSTLIAHLENKK